MSQGIIDHPYYFWGVKNEDEGLFYFCSKRSVLKELAEKSTAGIAGWTFSQSDYYYKMSWGLYQPLTNYLSKVVSVGIEMFKSHSQSPLPYFLEHLLEPTNRSIVSPHEIVVINTGIKNKSNEEWIYALCIHRDHIYDEKYSTYLRINREEKATIVQEMENRNASYYMYDVWGEKKLSDTLQVARGDAPPSFYGKIYEMVININNLTINKQNSILGDPNHYYEHMDRIPGGLRPDCIDDAYIIRVNDNSDIIENDNDNRDKKKRIKKQRIRDFKEDCPPEKREYFELKMEKVIKEAVERVKRNPRLAIPYGLNNTNKESDTRDTLSLGQFVIPLYYEGKVVLGLTLRCKISNTRVKQMIKIIANSLEKEKKTRKGGLDEYYEILKFRYCTYSVDTILPLPIVRMNVLPYVDCDVSNLWCFNNH